MDIWLKDPKTKKPSVTLSLLVLGFAVATFKLLLSSFTFYGFSFEVFSGADYALVLGSLGGVYGLRKHQDGKLSDDPNERTL